MSPAPPDPPGARSRPWRTGLAVAALATAGVVALATGALDRLDPAAIGPEAATSAPAGGLRVAAAGVGDGARVSGAVPLSARVSGGRAARVEFRVDGRLRWTERYAPYRYGRGTLNTRNLANGSRRIVIRAIGRDGSVATAGLRVIVANAAAPGQPPGGGGAPGPAPATPPAGSAENYPYDPRALFNRPVPAGTASDPRSAGVVAELRANLAANKFNFNVDTDTPPVYAVGPGDPFLQVRGDGIQTRFRVPAGAIVGGGSDHPLVLLDPNHPDHGRDVELRLWRASINRAAGTLTAQGVGLFKYNNDGARLNPDGTISQSRPFRGAGAGSGLSYLAGLVRAEEVRAGEIRHALRFSYACNDSSDRFRAPATKTDQPHPGCGADPSATPASRKMDMGMRLQLDPAVDCDARVAPTLPGTAGSPSQTRFLRILCRALQTHGMIMLDGTGPDGFGIYLEDDATARWGEVIGARWSGNYGWIARDTSTPGDGLSRGPNSGIPWDRLRVVAPFG